MDSAEIRKRFISFFSAKGGHVIVPSSSLIPDDPSILLTTAGMQQFKPYYSNPSAADKDFGSRNIVSIQKSFRTSDIEEVGDESHLTFFEMLGNFSFGGYFKKEAIVYAHEFITKEMGLEISYVTIFKGESSINVPRDEESWQIWQSLGITKIREEGTEDVFWGPTGLGGPCGPTTEIYCQNVAGQDIEVWNIVFNEFLCSGSRDDLMRGNAKLAELPQKGIDTGMGLERLAMSAQKTATIFQTDLFKPLMDILPVSIDSEVQKRIITDHLRGSVFLLADGVRPSNKGVGYVLRRLLRRILAYERTQHISSQVFESVILKIIELYGNFYPELETEKNTIINEFLAEREKFTRLLPAALKELETLCQIAKNRNGAAKEKNGDLPVMWQVKGDEAFNLYQSHGLTEDIIGEELANHGCNYDEEGFAIAKQKHQEISRAGLEKKFGGHGLILDTGELKASNEEELQKVTRLHTATHLLQAALRKVLGDQVHQMGSDITAERARFDFSFGRKVGTDELLMIERMVNDAISRDFTVEAKKMPYEEAIKTGALYFFREKYPAEVNVYSVYNKGTGEVFSRELCGGPHVSHTGEIGEFKILKEESSSAGVRRIRATVQ